MGTTRFQWDPQESHGNGNRNTGFLFKQYNSLKFKREWESFLEINGNGITILDIQVTWNGNWSEVWE